MKHTITITHEVEAETWDKAVAIILRSDNPVEQMVRCQITNEVTDLLEVNQMTLQNAAELVRDQMDTALPGSMSLQGQIPGSPAFGTIYLNGYRLVSVKHLRLLLRDYSHGVTPLLESAIVVMQKSAARGNTKAQDAIKGLSNLINLR